MSRRSYYATVRALRDRYSIPWAKARIAWRALREKLGRSPVGRDVARHPRWAKQAVAQTISREVYTRIDQAIETAKVESLPVEPLVQDVIEEAAAEADDFGYRDVYDFAVPDEFEPEFFDDLDDYVEWELSFDAVSGEHD